MWSTGGTSATATCTTPSCSRRSRNGATSPPGEVRIVTLESQPAHIQRQQYRIYDAATGLIEEGWVNVADMVAQLPWLDEAGTFPVEVAGAGAPAAPAAAPIA